MAVSKDEVLLCYRLFLGREPESEKVIGDLMTRHENISSLRQSFLRSTEFLASLVDKSPTGFMPPDRPKNEIEHHATAAQLAACHAKIKASWEHLGKAKPHYSVLVGDLFLPENVGENIDFFWSTGESEVDMVEKMLARHDFNTLSKKTCVEYGCGVGRVTMALARRFAQVHAYDISREHLSLARQRGTEVGITNCRYHLCPENLLDPLETCDFYYSRIVFQHNPPPIIHQLISNALRALTPGGIAIFQVPVYKSGYRFSLQQWLAADHALDMQMHCLPQEVIFAIIAEEDCIPLEVMEDSATGAHRSASYTFVIRKKDGANANG